MPLAYRVGVTPLGAWLGVVGVTPLGAYRVTWLRQPLSGEITLALEFLAPWKAGGSQVVIWSGVARLLSPGAHIGRT